MANEPTQKSMTKKHMARLEKERMQRRYLIIGTIVVAILVVGVLVYGILDQTVIKNNRPVAKVGNDVITTAQFQKEVRFQRYQLIQQLQQFAANPMYLQFLGSYVDQIKNQLNNPTSLGQQVLDQMVEENLVAKEAKARGIAMSNTDIDQAFQEAFGFYANGTLTPTLTPTEWLTETLSPLQQTLLPPTSTPNLTLTPQTTGAAETATATAEVTSTPTQTVEPTAGATSTPTTVPTITPTPTPYTLEGFQKAAATYAANVKDIGYSQSDLRALIGRQALRQKVYDAITKDVPATAEQVWARHILVATEDEAKKVEERLKNGEKFDDLAKELSTDTSNKDKGGDLGWFTKGKMVEAFETEAFKLKAGETSQPVKTSFGYHVIQVLGHEDRPLDATQYEEAKQKAYQDWLTKAKKDANVQTMDIMAQVVPTDPTIPADLQSVLDQYSSQQQQQQNLLPTVSAVTSTPAPKATTAK